MKKIITFLFIVTVLACKSEKEQKEENDAYVIPASEKTAEKTPLQESMARGKEIYSDFCVACHLPNGKGIPGTYPPLDGSNWLTEKRKESIRAVKYGLSGPIEVNGEKYNNVMTPLGLSDREVADVLNYVMNSWSNDIDEPVTPEEVAAVEKK